MERAKVAIIFAEAGFASNLTKKWQREREAPSFCFLRSDSPEQLGAATFDLAVLGGLDSSLVSPVLELLAKNGRPVILVSRLNGHSPRAANMTVVPEIAEWPELVIAIAKEVLDRQRANAEIRQLLGLTSKLEHEASLGRYMLDMRHNLNNALTSILGNSDLILLDQAELPAPVRSQIETIRNMGMRMNEIMQRFSSLQKEMQLVEQQIVKKAASASAGQ